MGGRASVKRIARVENYKCKSNGKREIQGSFPFGFTQRQDDDVKQTTATTRTTAIADPYGMTNKKGNYNDCNGNSDYDCTVR
jgi:hypothetical protein